MEDVMSPRGLRYRKFDVNSSPDGSWLALLNLTKILSDYYKLGPLSIGHSKEYLDKLSPKERWIRQFFIDL